jgi:hypothetical protein
MAAERRLSTSSRRRAPPRPAPGSRSAVVDVETGFDDARPGMSRNSRQPTPVVLAAGAGLIGALVLVANYGAGWSNCGAENTYCAVADSTRSWLGRVFTSDGRPARATVKYRFESIRAQVLVPTDDLGRYCLQWPQERLVAYVVAINVRPAGPPDPHITNLPASAIRTPWGRSSASIAEGPLVVSPDGSLGGLIRPSPDEASTRATSAAWDSSTDVTDVCVKQSPPWCRIDNLSANWRYRMLTYASLAVLLLAAGALLPSPFRLRPARASLGLATADLTLFVLVWITKTV